MWEKSLVIKEIYKNSPQWTQPRFGWTRLITLWSVLSLDYHSSYCVLSSWWVAFKGWPGFVFLLHMTKVIDTIICIANWYHSIRQGLVKMSKMEFFSTKFKVEKINGRENFRLCRRGLRQYWENLLRKLTKPKRHERWGLMRI